MTKRFLASEGVAAVVVALIVLTAAAAGLFDGLERRIYDLGVQVTDTTPDARISLVVIDESSLHEWGAWPWSRVLQGELIARISAGKPAVIGETFLYDTPDRHSGLEQIRNLREQLKKSSISSAPDEIALLDVMLEDTGAALGNAQPPAFRELRRYFNRSDLKRQLARDISVLDRQLVQIERELDTDRSMAANLAAAGNVLLPADFTLGRTAPESTTPFPEYLQRQALRHVREQLSPKERIPLPLNVQTAQVPFAVFGQQAAGVAYFNARGYPEGGLATAPLVVRHGQEFYPSLALLLAAKGIGLSSEDISVRLGEGVNLGPLRIATTNDLRMLPRSYGGHNGHSPFERVSASDVLQSKIPATSFTNRIVLIGLGESSPGTTNALDDAWQKAPVLHLAETVSSLLKEDFLVLPHWAKGAGIAVSATIVLFLALALPILRSGPATIATGLILTGIATGHAYLLIQENLWLSPIPAMLLLLAGYSVILAKRLLASRCGLLGLKIDTAETIRQLGLTLQEQGRLDQAFEQFRRLPINSGNMEILYDLGRKFEEKRQFDKAQAVYRHISSHDAHYRDIRQRLEQAGTSAVADAHDRESGQPQRKPALQSLGRYRIERQIGRGAMGAVYLGRDPKIGRTVAVKTMALEREFETDEIDAVKHRFFREAETAGRLNHPHIVTIYDAGEEHGLAYIAMEYLSGENLGVYTRLNDLLPLPEVMEVIATCAETLDYAHGHHVIHRDIKPANVMYRRENGELKITDFGIARISDSTKTKTGMVLGTPSYMSPEQLAGKKVDGRSDLFSLGVMLFQLSTGQLPFHADSMASLMYKIANDEHPPLRGLRPDAPPCLQRIVDKAMAKHADQRYQRGAELARELRECVRIDAPK